MSSKIEDLVREIEKRVDSIDRVRLLNAYIEAVEIRQAARDLQTKEEKECLLKIIKRISEGL